MEIKKEKPNRDQVIAKALTSLMSSLDISQQTIGDIIGLSTSSICRLSEKGGSVFSHNKKSAEHAALFLRACRSLKSIVGSATNMKLWLNAENSDFDGKAPIDLLKHTEGLIDVCRYLDSMRGKI
ncbi:MAG: DUF2384 domain-containing protein [Oligoflexales bacterium]|nr:DUF2384 domain-containing protein [Oligoflexales bacterium]